MTKSITFLQIACVFIFAFEICVILICVLTKKKRAHKDDTIPFKIKVIRYHEGQAGRSTVRSTAEHFGRPPSTVQGWLTNKESILRDYALMGSCRQRKRMRLAVNPLLDVALLEYFNSFQKHHPSVAITDESLMAWSIAISKKIG
jgi:hypothetical protein